MLQENRGNLFQIRYDQKESLFSSLVKRSLGWVSCLFSQPFPFIVRKIVSDAIILSLFLLCVLGPFFLAEVIGQW